MKHQNVLEILEDGRENIPDSAWGKRQGSSLLGRGGSLRALGGECVWLTLGPGCEELYVWEKRRLDWSAGVIYVLEWVFELVSKTIMWYFRKFEGLVNVINTERAV